MRGRRLWRSLRTLGWLLSVSVMLGSRLVLRCGGLYPVGAMPNLALRTVRLMIFAGCQTADTDRSYGNPLLAARRLGVAAAIALMLVPAFIAAPNAQAAAAPAASPASLGPPPAPANLPCQPEWCQKLIEHLCHRIDCALLSNEFRGTAAEGDARAELKQDKAFQKPWNGRDFDVHHIVPQGGACFGVAVLAQSLLMKVGIKANDPENLAVLRGFRRQVGKPGYKELPPDLKKRMAHADTRACYYYQKVNERFAEWQRRHGGARGRLPNESEVRAILRSIKRDLYNGGKDFIKPGVRPRLTPPPLSQTDTRVLWSCQWMIRGRALRRSVLS